MDDVGQRPLPFAHEVHARELRIEDSIVITVAGLAQATPTTKFLGASITVQMSKDAIDQTAIYYWASSQGRLLTQAFGTTDAPTSVRDNCTSCHSVSRTGTRIGYSRCVANNCDNIAVGFMRLVNGVWTDTVNADALSILGSYTTFSPTGNPYPDDDHAAALVAKRDSGLALYDPDTGLELPSNLATVSQHGSATPRTATMPDWSPDGKTVVFASAPDLGHFVDVAASSLATMTYALSGNMHTFGEPTFILDTPITLPSGVYNSFFFPRFSPDGTIIVFNAARDAWRNFTSAAAAGQRLMLTNTAAACVSNGVQQCKQIWIGAIDTSKLRRQARGSQRAAVVAAGSKHRSGQHQPLLDGSGQHPLTVRISSPIAARIEAGPLGRFARARILPTRQV